MTDAPERFCSHCGRRMIERTYGRGFDSRSGLRIIDRAVVCPRFDRSWRNLWLGGWMHNGYQVDENDRLGLELSWM